MAWLTRILLLPALIAAEAVLAAVLLGHAGALPVDLPAAAALTPEKALLIHAAGSPLIAAVLLLAFPGARRVSPAASFLAFTFLAAPLPLAGLLLAAGIGAIMEMPAREELSDARFAVGNPYFRAWGAPPPAPELCLESAAELIRSRPAADLRRLALGLAHLPAGRGEPALRKLAADPDTALAVLAQGALSAQNERLEQLRRDLAERSDPSAQRALAEVERRLRRDPEPPPEPLAAAFAQRDWPALRDALNALPESALRADPRLAAARQFWLGRAADPNISPETADAA